MTKTIKIFSPYHILLSCQNTKGQYTGSTLQQFMFYYKFSNKYFLTQIAGFKVNMAYDGRTIAKYIFFENYKIADGIHG